MSWLLRKKINWNIRDKKKEQIGETQQMHHCISFISECKELVTRNSKSVNVC